MRTKQEIAQLLAKMEPQSAYGDFVYSSLDKAKSAAKRLVKPQNYSILQSKTGEKFMITTNKRASLFIKSGDWTYNGYVLDDGSYQKGLNPMPK
jgi:hypothetical protein